MAERGIREYDGKLLLAKYIKNSSIPGKLVLVTPETKLGQLGEKNQWLKKTKLVVKPDQLFGKRGKNKLILLNANLAQATAFIKKNMNRTATVGKTTGVLTHFLIEPFVPHDEEYYLAMKMDRDGDNIYFSTKGGVDVEENWANVKTTKVPILGSLSNVDFKKLVPAGVKNREQIINFIKSVYKTFTELGFTYIEFNPFVFSGKNIVPLDLVAKLDDTAFFENAAIWGDLEFPAPFGRKLTREEHYIKKIDEDSGASLKLTILNPKGKVWTMVAGGGASVIYSDTVCDLGFSKELANYGEYSGNPSTEETYNYAKTILDLMTRNNGKILIIGGGIANFTDVAKTFTGIIQALREYAPKLKKNKVKIYVRRGGPNFKEGLDNMRKLGKETGIPIKVHGPESHMTAVVPIALGVK
ncbi:MAG: ATP citrate lyase citrate-binding domain-containing protein [archaeon]